MCPEHRQVRSLLIIVFTHIIRFKRDKKCFQPCTKRIEFFRCDICGSVYSGSAKMRITGCFFSAPALRIIESARLFEHGTPPRLIICATSFLLRQPIAPAIILRLAVSCLQESTSLIGFTFFSDRAVRRWPAIADRSLTDTFRTVI